MSEYASYRARNIPVISPATQEYLENLLQKTTPQSCIEIGGAVGYSTRCIGKQIQQRNGNIVSFEISSPAYRENYIKCKEKNLNNTTLYNIDILQSDVSKILWPQRFDFGFIDAQKAEYADYFTTLLPFFTSGATIVFDDVIAFASKVRPLYKMLTAQKHHYDIIPLSDGDGVCKVQL